MARQPLARLSAAGAVAAAVLLVACGPGAYRYEANRGLGVHLKVPRSWHVLDQAALRPLYGDPGAEQSGRGRLLFEAVRWERAWDGSRSPDPLHVLPSQADAPVAHVVVRALDPSERGAVSMDALRNLAVGDYVERRDQWLEDASAGRATLINPDLEPLVDEELYPEGFRGVKLLFTVRDAAGTLHTLGVVALVDDRATLLYRFVVHCTARCFEANERQMRATLDSFTVEED